MTPLEDLYKTLADISLAYAHLDTPYRGMVEVRDAQRPPGPRAPVSAAVVDQRGTTRRTLAAITREQARYLDHAPAGYDVEHCLAWLVRHAAAVVDHLHPGDLRDLEVLREQLVRLSGIHSADTDAAVELAEARRTAMPGASHYGSARETARLATAAGRPITRGTVQRWADDGLVETREIGGSEHYSLDDVLLHHDLREAEAAQEERPQYGEGHRGSSRAVAALATDAGWPVSYDTVQRWAASGHVDRDAEGYSYDDVMTQLISRQEDALEYGD